MENAFDPKTPACGSGSRVNFASRTCSAAWFLLPESPDTNFLLLERHFIEELVMIQTGLEEKRHSDVDKWYQNYWQRLRAREQVLVSVRAPRAHWYWSEELNEAEEIIFERTCHA